MAFKENFSFDEKTNVQGEIRASILVNLNTPICFIQFISVHLFQNETTNQLLFLSNEIHLAFENPKFLVVCAVFLDISNAFDKVWHDRLIFRLKQNWVSGSLLMFFQNYSNNRKQHVVLNSSRYSYSIVESGVPQGLALGPLLFLIYINDLERNIRNSIKFFADDTMLFSIVNVSVIFANNLKFYFLVRNLVLAIHN